MPINPVDMVSYAQSLLVSSADEMVIRGVINRAYYGAFLAARDSAGITRVTNSVHKDVSTHFRAVDPLISNNLEVMKKLRERADYHPTDTLRFHEAKSACKRAQKILSRI